MAGIMSTLDASYGPGFTYLHADILSPFTSINLNGLFAHTGKVFGSGSSIVVENPVVTSKIQL